MIITSVNNIMMTTGIVAVGTHHGNKNNNTKICRARGDHHEGWRPGFNLKGYNDGTQLETACNIAAAAMELSKKDFQCQCHAAIHSRPAHPEMSMGTP
jgi:hypothetical protein